MHTTSNLMSIIILTVAIIATVHTKKDMLSGCCKNCNNH